MKNPKQIAPYGTWQSPFTTEEITKDAKSFYELNIDGEDIYCLEGRPDEKGRAVIVKYQADGSQVDITPPTSDKASYNVRTRVHEYGGGAFTVKDGVVYFVNNSDQRVYRQDGVKDSTPSAITAPGARYAHLIATTNGLIAIREKHSEAFPSNSELVENTIVFIDFNTGNVSTLVSGHDFYAFPVLSPDETKLAWVGWNHPNMPWDTTELWCGDFKQGQLVNSQKITGQDNESIVEPKWSTSNVLYFVSDRSNWWNIYQVIDNQNSKAILKMDAEFTTPAWVHGLSNWDFIGNKLLASYRKEGLAHLIVIDPENESYETLTEDGTDFAQIKASSQTAAFLKGSASKPTELIRLKLNNLDSQTLAMAQISNIEKEYISQPKTINFPSVNGRTSKAILYLPQNQDYSAPKEDLPPLIVKSHGGPTGCATPAYDPKIQYWTSRGFAVIDVNYGGSTGYGRQYRESLKKGWGIVDREDCEQAALFLVQKEWVDANKLFIRGGSAGGYTTLCALTFGTVFKGGASYYGVSDLEALAKETHKFESRYLDELIAPYPEGKSIYKQRSPINFASELKVPVIFFQGGEDKVVPENQAQAMAEALSEQGIKNELVVYPEEQHGFRQASTIQDSLQKELDFYLQLMS